MATLTAIGNPLADGTWTYAWQAGRQLASMSKTGTSASFLYNADGLRVRKTVNGVITDYTLHGKNVVHLKQGSNRLHFFYDASGKPSHVNFNGTMYLYVHNLQGDIIAIRDAAGNNVVTYSYNAWGKPLSKAGSLAATLGTLNPFRYRGYVYDEETGLYYLRSRYYNPSWCRFLFADDTNFTTKKSIADNMYTYCSSNPVIAYDSDGADTQLIITYLPSPLVEKTTTGKYGSHGMESLIPRSFFIGGLFQMKGESWKYRHNMAYGYADCNGIVRFIAQQYYNYSAYGESGYNIRTKVSEIKKINTTNVSVLDLSLLEVGMVLFSYDLSHMAVYVGKYGSNEHAIIESTPSGGVHVSDLLTQLYSKTKKGTHFSEAGYLKFIDYSSAVFLEATWTIESD